MLLSEDEAKTKRCPEGFSAVHVTDNGHPLYRQIPSLDGGAANFTVKASAPACCIGSACMAWRWKRWELDPVDRHRIRGTVGYCGKAGIPDE
jgi:hypothetical protein